MHVNRLKPSVTNSSVLFCLRLSALSLVLTSITTTRSMLVPSRTLQNQLKLRDPAKILSLANADSQKNFLRNQATANLKLYQQHPIIECLQKMSSKNQPISQAVIPSAEKSHRGKPCLQRKTQVHRQSLLLAETGAKSS